MNLIIDEFLEKPTMTYSPMYWSIYNFNLQYKEVSFASLFQ